MYWEKGKLTKVFKEAENVKQLTIVTAFFSVFGLQLLKQCIKKNKLSKNQVFIYLSQEFDTKEPHNLLEELIKIANVKIVDKQRLHAKVYLFKYPDYEELIYGSANFTKGGFEDNVEFYSIEKVSNTSKVVSFLTFCEKNSVNVNQELVLLYKEKISEINDLRKDQKRISNSIAAIFKQDDPFLEHDYDLTKHYFTFSDYETLFPKNQRQKTKAIKEKRKEIQDKMIDINKLVKKKMKNLNLHNHWSEKNLTSSLDPNIFNHGKVGWIGVRYGKAKNEVKFLNDSYGLSNDTEDYGNFQKHACMQFSIVPNGIKVGLFHAVSNDAIDRMHLHDKIDRKSKEIINCLNDLKGERLIWHILDSKKGNDINTFNVDLRNPEDFISFYKQHDKKGFESFLTYDLPPDDELIKSKESIAELIHRKILAVKPLYEIISFRPVLKN